MAEQSYEGKVIVITGASSGFGKGAAIELARRKASVVLAARREHALEDVARECQAVGGKAHVVATDVSIRDEVEALAAEAKGMFGHFDVWINDAGVGAIGRFDEVPLIDHEQVLRTNLLGTTYGSWFAMRHFRDRKEGILINIASVVGKIPAPYYATYTASKFGVVGLCDSLRQELRESGEGGIRVCTVLPVAHATPFFEHAANYTGHATVPIPPTYDPKTTIDVIVRMVGAPEDEVIAGGQGKIMNFLHHLMPHQVEKLMAMNTHKEQIEKAPPAPPTSGIVHPPPPAIADAPRPPSNFGMPKKGKAKR